MPKPPRTTFFASPEMSQANPKRGPKFFDCPRSPGFPRYGMGLGNDAGLTSSLYDPRSLSQRSPRLSVSRGSTFQSSWMYTPYCETGTEVYWPGMAAVNCVGLVRFAMVAGSFGLKG